MCRRSYHWQFCMFLQGQHIDTVNFVIWHCFQFDLSLTFDPLSVGRTKRSQWTLLHLCPRVTHWPFYFCHLTHLYFDFLTFDPLSVGRTKRSPWTLLHLRPRLTHWPFNFCHLTHLLIWPFLTFDPLTIGHWGRSCMFAQHQHIDTVNIDTGDPTPTRWHCYFCHLTHFVIWPFSDLWPLNRRSDEEVTVDTYACLPNTNTLTLLLLSFEIVCNLNSFLTPVTPNDLWLTGDWQLL